MRAKTSTMLVGPIQHHYAPLKPKVSSQCFLLLDSQSTCSEVRNVRKVACFCNGPIRSMTSGAQNITEKIGTTTIEGQQLYYRSFGKDHDRPLVLLHGFGVSGYMWQRCIPYLARQAQVLVVDLPGHGHSRLSGAWQLRAMAPLLASWIEQMGIAPVRLVGHSMGGAIAVHLTASAPDLVERLVLVNAAGIPLETTIPALCVRSVRSILQPGGGGYPLRLLGDVLKPRPRLFWQAARELVKSDFRAE